MQYIKEIPNLDVDLLNNLTNQILSESKEFTHSLLYDPKGDQKVIDESIRTSEFRLFTDKKYFNMIQLYLDIINKNDPHTNFLLLRNDISHIKYQKGGFFKAHEDYLSFNSNMVEEYTMIICLKADAKGGETIIHLNPFFRHISKATITPGHSLIFRKDLTHEGALLEEGYKEILTMNLLAMPKKAEKTVIVSFPKSDNKKNEEHYYLIPLSNIEQIPNNYIWTKLRFTNELNSKNNLLYYLEEHSTSENFEIINRVFQKEALDATEIDANKELLDYYQLDITKLMTRAVLGGLSSNPNTIKVKKPSKPLEVKMPNMGQDVVVYGDQAEFQYALELVKRAKLPLMPFTMIWMEGGCNGEPTPLSVGAVLFSEYQNLLYLRKLLEYQGGEQITPYDFYSDIYDWSCRHFDIEEDRYTCYRHFLRNLIFELPDGNSENEEKRNEYFNRRKSKISQYFNRRKIKLREYHYNRYIDNQSWFNENGTMFFEGEEALEDENHLYTSAVNTDDENEIADNMELVDDSFYLNKGYRDNQTFNLSFLNDENEFDPSNPKVLDVKIPDSDDYHEIEGGFNASLYLEVLDPVQKLLESMFYEVDRRTEKEKFSKINYRRCHFKVFNSIYQGTHYNLDNDGKLCLEYRHLLPLMNRMKEIQLIDQVKEFIPNLPIKNLQKDSYDAFMCNEQVYGTINLVAVYGFMKME